MLFLYIAFHTQHYRQYIRLEHVGTLFLGRQIVHKTSKLKLSFYSMTIRDLVTSNRNDA
jgi:hypothetical protein